MNKLKYIFVVCWMLLASQTAMSNATMPGFWEVGTGINFVPFFAKDSVHLQHIQMQSELVTVQLYPGFAIVKGEYYMKNLSDKSITIKTGYPIESNFRNKSTFSVEYARLHRMQVKIDDKLTDLRLLSDNNVEVYKTKPFSDFGRWYVWDCTYKPNSITKLTVYFLLNNNDAQLRRGYNYDKHNGFGYLIESGRVWAKKINKGRIYIKLMGGLKPKDLRGVYPVKTFKTDGKNQLIYDFNDLEPDDSNNVVVRYSDKLSSFNFDNIDRNFTNYFKQIDKLDGSKVKTDGWQTITAADFEVHARGGGWSVGLIMIANYSVPILLVLLGLLTLWHFVRKRLKKQQS